MTQWPRHGRIDGPIVMIGFGSIGKGTLPLIERHFEFDKSRFVVIDPDDSDRKTPGRARRRLRPARDHARQLSRRLDQISDRGRGPGVLRQPVGRHLVARSHASLPRDRRALCRHGRRALAGLLLRQVARQRGAHQLRLARDGACRTAQESGRLDRHLLLRRQSGHGVVVRQAGAGQSRPRSRRQGVGAEDQRGMGAPRAAPRRQGRAYRRARHPARQEPEAAQRVRQHLVGRRFPVGRDAARGARLGQP